MVKRALGAVALTIVVIVAVWTSLVVSYEDDRGTDNHIAVLQSTSFTAATDDLLGTLSFEESSEPLLWSSLEPRRGDAEPLWASLAARMTRSGYHWRFARAALGVPWASQGLFFAPKGNEGAVLLVHLAPLKGSCYCCYFYSIFEVLRLIGRKSI